MLIFIIIAFVGSLSLYLHSALPAVIVSGALIALWLTVWISDEVEKDRAQRRRVALAKQRRATRNRRGF